MQLSMKKERQIQSILLSPNRIWESSTSPNPTKKLSFQKKDIVQLLDSNSAKWNEVASPRVTCTKPTGYRGYVSSRREVILQQKERTRQKYYVSILANARQQ